MLEEPYILFIESFLMRVSKIKRYCVASGDVYAIGTNSHYTFHTAGPDAFTKLVGEGGGGLQPYSVRNLTNLNNLEVFFGTLYLLIVFF